MLVAVAVAAFVMLRFWNPCDPPSKPVPAATGDDAGSTSGATGDAAGSTDAGRAETTGEVQTVVPDDLGTSTTASAVTGA